MKRNNLNNLCLYPSRLLVIIALAAGTMFAGCKKEQGNLQSNTTPGITVPNESADLSFATLPTKNEALVAGV
jgi:uncharacterized lipoprotein YajG